MITKSYLIGAAASLGLISISVMWFNSKMTDAYNDGVASVIKQYKDKEQEYLLDKAKDDIKIIKEDIVDRVQVTEQKSEATVKIQKVIEYVDREIKVNVGCELLASDVVKLRTEATNIINSAARRKD